MPSLHASHEWGVSSPPGHSDTQTVWVRPVLADPSTACTIDASYRLSRALLSSVHQPHDQGIDDGYYHIATAFL